MKKILFCGGGSAGHVIPNIAIIEELGDAFSCEYAGTDGIEKSICLKNGVKFHQFEAAKLVRGKIFKNFLLPFKLISSIKQAGEILDEYKPDLVFCKGGYACVPPAVAAKKRNIPVIAHESDVSAGLANKFIAGRCEKVLTSFPSAARQFKKGICTGSPMRTNLFGRSRAAAMEKFGLDMRPTLLVLGGGSGSKIINENLRKIAGELSKDYNILHLCGRGNAVDTNIRGYRQIEFADDMGEVYACADAAVSRCGSNAAFELIALKIPTLFIPLENKSSRGDQVKNGEYFSSLGLCKILREGDVTAEKLLEGVRGIFNDGKIKAALDASSVKCGNEAIIKEIINTML